MMFVNSIKLFGSNWAKVLKFLLYYVVVMGLSFALFLPAFFEFKDLLTTSLYSGMNSFSGILAGSLGEGLHEMIVSTWGIVVSAFAKNLGLAIYGLIVLFVFMPFFVNVGKYTFYEMMYSYMTSKSKIGFFSAFALGLKKSLLFGLAKTFYNIIFLGATFSCVYAIGLIEDVAFIAHALPIIIFVLLVVLFSLNQILVLGWAPAMNVFDCNVFVGFRKGIKAVRRHFWSILGTTALYFVLFWTICLVFGLYPLVALTPIMTVALCVYNMVVFFTSQGMRFYVTNNKILTPKKLEEVDNINKTAYIL